MIPSKIILRSVSIFATVMLATGLSAYGQPQNVSSHIKKAFYEGRFQAVVRSYESLSSSDSLSARTYYLVGRSYRELLQPRKALMLLQKAHRLDSSSTAVLQALGMTYEQLGNLEAAEKAYRRVLRMDSTNFRIRLALGELYMKRRKWQSAISEYRRLVTDDSTNSILHARLGRCYAALDNLKKARFHFKQAHRLNPQNVDVTLHLSRLYFKEKQWTKALRVVNETLDYHPNESRLWRRRADIHFQQDSMQTAAYEYMEVLQLGDTTAATLRKLGTCQVMLENYEGAVGTLKKAYRRDTTNAVTCFYLGIAYRETDSLDQSLTFLNRAVDLLANGVLVNTFKQLGETYDARQELPEAVDAYKTALDLNPERSDIYFRLAVLYDTYYKDKSVALLYYRKYLSESKDEKHLQKRILSLYANNRISALEELVHFQ